MAQPSFAHNALPFLPVIFLSYILCACFPLPFLHALEYTTALTVGLSVTDLLSYAVGVYRRGIGELQLGLLFAAVEQY